MRRNQSVTIAALIIAIVGLSIGFAAFSNTLTIRSSATVNPDSSSLRVVFSLDDDSEVPGGTGGVTPDSNTYGDPGTIDNTQHGNSKIEGLHAKFTQPGQSVKYNVASANLYVYNAGSLQAQLTGVTFNNAQGVNTYKKCTAVTENKQATEIATDALVQAACSDITISVKVGSKVATPQDTSLNYQILGVGESLPAEITITYGGNVYVDGDFEVSFGDVEINATSAVNTALVPQAPTYSVGDVYTGDYVSTTAGTLTEYRGSSQTVEIPDALPVVEVSSSTFSMEKCVTLVGDSNYCSDVEDYYNGEETILTDDEKESADAVIPYCFDSTYTIVNSNPQTITSIGPGAFVSKGITSVEFTNNITEVEDGAFAYNSINALDIPSSITTIGVSAFYGNPLTNGVTIHNVEGAVMIGKEAFDDSASHTATITYVGTGN